MTIRACGVGFGVGASELSQGDLRVEQSLWGCWRPQLRWDLRPCLIKGDKWAISETDFRGTCEHLSLISYIGAYSIDCLDNEIGVSPFFQNGYKAFSCKLAFEFTEYEEGEMKWNDCYSQALGTGLTTMGKEILRSDLEADMEEHPFVW